MSPLQKASYLMGGPTATAKRLGVTPQAVFFWLAGQRALSAEQCIAIERETGGAVTVEELRPDVDWAVIRGKAAPEKAGA